MSVFERNRTICSASPTILLRSPRDPHRAGRGAKRAQVDGSLAPRSMSRRPRSATLHRGRRTGATVQSEDRTPPTQSPFVRPRPYHSQPTHTLVAWRRRSGHRHPNTRRDGRSECHARSQTFQIACQLSRAHSFGKSESSSCSRSNTYLRTTAPLELPLPRSLRPGRWRQL